MSSDGTNRLYCTHTPHTHIHIPACIVPKLASRRGRCWSECHGWVNPKKEGTAQQHWWAELLLSVASCLDRMGFTAAQGHVALSGVWEDRHGGSAVGTVHDLSPFTASFQSLQQPGLVTLPTRFGVRCLHILLQPFRDKLSFTCWWAQRSPTLYNCTFTQSERTPHAYKLGPVRTPSHNCCHGVLSNTRAVTGSQWAYLEN